MRRFGLQVLFMACLVFLIACSRSDQDGTDNSENINQAIPIETINSDNAHTIPPFEVIDPSYEVASCDFQFDSIDDHITARYDDTEANPEGYIIDYDLIYYDYNVTEVSLYSATKRSSIAYLPIDLPDGWVEVNDCSGGMFTTNSDSSERHEAILNSILNYGVNEVECYDGVSYIVSSLDSYYNLFDHCFVYPYPVQTLNTADGDANSASTERRFR